MAINDVMAGGAPAAPQGMPPQATPQAPQAAPVAPAAQEAPMVGGENPATPADQEAYERTVLAGVQILSDPKTGPKVMASLKSGGEPAKLLATTTSQIFDQIDEQSGGTVPEIVIAKSAAEIMQNVAEFANNEGVLQVDQAVLGKAGQYLLMNLAETYDIPPEDLQGMSEGMSEQEIQGVVSEQQGFAGDGDPEANAEALAAPQAAPQAAAPQAGIAEQKLPSIINQTLGS